MEPDNVLDEVVYSFNLIVFKCDLHCISIVILSSLLLSHVNLIYDRILFIEVLLIFFTEKLLNGVGVKREN